MLKYPSWPLGIVVIFIVFILFKVGFIIFSRFHRVDLVSSDYYQQGINYQQQIERQKRTRSMSKNIRCEYNKSAELLKIVFPANKVLGNISGDIHLFRPSDAKQDKWFFLTLNASGEQIIDVRNLAKGLWRIKIKWIIQSNDYYFEDSIVF
jgi:hypothetical protein